MQINNNTLNSLRTILKELSKLNEERNFKGVYIDSKYFNDIQISFKDAIELINRDNKFRNIY